MPPISRRTVLPLPKTSQAIPIRGSKSIDLVCLKPGVAFASVDRTMPLVNSATEVPSANAYVPSAFLTKVPTRLIFVSKVPGVRGSKARRLEFEQELVVNATVQAGK